MRRRMATALVVVAALLAPVLGRGEDDRRTPRGPYLGQDPPGLTAEVFAPGVVSTQANELNCAFNPDGTELFFTVWKAGRNTLMRMKQEDGKWTERSVAPFSGAYSDVDPFVAPDGQRLYYSSMRPLDGVGEAKDSDLWYVEKGEGRGWSDPVHLGAPNAEGKDDYYTSTTRDGTLYYSVFPAHGAPGDIYRARLQAEGYGEPEIVGAPVSTASSEHDPFVAPDESYLIFTSDRPGGLGRGDLYVSFRTPGGAWSEPRNMGEAVNSAGYDFCPMLSPDGKYLFFTRNTGGNGDIFWVDARVIERSRTGQPK